MKLAFGFDLHNTIMDSNAAWIESFMKQVSTENYSYIIRSVYNKKSRKCLATEFNLDYDTILDGYHKLVKYNEKMIEIVKRLHVVFPVYLISSSSREKVERDLSTWRGEEHFDIIYTKESFDKGNIKDWKNLIDSNDLDLLVYLGNDIEEDIIKENRVVSLINGKFLDELLSLDMLRRRGEQM